MHKVFGLGAGLVLLFAASPSSSNYTLKSYDIGTGGGSGSSSNYKINGISGAQSSRTPSSTNYGNVSGVNITQTANVPPAPTLTNPSSYYDRLKLVINTASNPSDTKYLIAVSPDAFSSTIYYVQSDNSIGSSLSITDYQTYTAWGGASGFLILGLTPSTTYTVKIKALQGDFSGSAFSPTTSAATQQQTVSFSFSTSLTGTPPFISTFTGLLPGTVSTSNADPILGFSTNAVSGGYAYITSQFAGLKSSSQSTTITSATADLSSATSGYGVMVISSGQTSGGPVSAVSPFNGSSNNVGGVTTSLQPILSASQAVTSATATLNIKAKPSITTPPATDYTDTLTVIMAMNF